MGPVTEKRKRAPARAGRLLDELLQAKLASGRATDAEVAVARFVAFLVRGETSDVTDSALEAAEAHHTQEVIRRQEAADAP